MLAACGKKGVDVRALEKSFATGPEAVKVQVEKAVEAIKAERYSEAITTLGGLTDSSLLSKEQQAAVKNALAQLGDAAAAKAGKFDLSGIRQLQ